MCAHLQGSSKQYRTAKETLVNVVIGLALLPPQGISENPGSYPLLSVQILKFINKLLFISDK